MYEYHCVKVVGIGDLKKELVVR